MVFFYNVSFACGSGSRDGDIQSQRSEPLIITSLIGTCSLHTGSGENLSLLSDFNGCYQLARQFHKGGRTVTYRFDDTKNAIKSHRKPVVVEGSLQAVDESQDRRE